MECNLDSLRAIGIDLEPTVKRFCDDTGLLVEMLRELVQHFNQQPRIVAEALHRRRQVDADCP